MSGVITFNARCHNIIQNANLAIIFHITKQKTKKSKTPKASNHPSRSPVLRHCRSPSQPPSQHSTQPAAAPMCHSCPPVPATPVPQSQPQLSPSPSHNCPPVPATAVPQSQPQLSTMLRCHRSHPASIPASEVPCAAALPQPQPATHQASQQASKRGPP